MKSKGHTVSFINRFFNSFFSYAFLVMLFVVSFVFNTSSASATSTLTVSIPFDRISLNLVGVNNEPTFAKSNDASFTVSTTNSTGYTVNIKSNTTGGNDGSGVLLLNGNDSNYTISSIGGNDFPVGGINESTYRTSSTYNNTWGYKPSMIDSSSNSNFLPSPDATGDTINVTNCANGTENTTCTNMTDTYSIAIGAKVDSTVRIGSYSNTFVILAVANAIPYTIIYDDNTVTNMPVDVSTTSQADSVNISSNVPVKDGYTFLGWCDTTPITTNGVDSCPSGSTIYNPNGAGTNLAYTLNRQGGSNNLHLYAMWSGSASVSYIPVTVQFAGTGANNIDGVVFTYVYDNANSSITFNDTRTVKVSGTVVQLVSGASYAITGVYDGGFFESWSTLGGTLGDNNSPSTTFTVTSASTLTLSATNKLYFQHATSNDCGETMYDNRGTEAYKSIGYSTAMINGLCWMTRNLDLPGGTTIYKTDSNITADSYTLLASSPSGFSDTYDQNVYNTGSTTCGSNSPCYSYYTFVAATAGTGTTSSDTTNDICPYGWRLPTMNEYEALKAIYSTGATLTAAPFLGAYAGYYAQSNLGEGGTSGNYWTSTVSSNVGAYHFYYNSTNASLYSYNKRHGRSIRCVAKS